MEKTLEGKVVLVTGASTGIGRDVCIEAAARGAKVILMSRDQALMQETASLIPHTETLIVPLDLTDFEAYPRAIESITDWSGVPYGVAWCAGLSVKARLRDTVTQMMDEAMRVNCFSFVEMMRLMVRKKKTAQTMRAVALSSLAVLGQHKYFTAYAASKAALEVAAKVMATELMPKNVFINIIRCAIVGTRITVGAEELIGDFNVKLKENGYQPLGVIPPLSVAKMLVWLLDSDSSYTTGCIFNINAGAPN